MSYWRISEHCRSEVPEYEYTATFRSNEKLDFQVATTLACKSLSYLMINYYGWISDCMNSIAAALINELGTTWKTPLIERWRDGTRASEKRNDHATNGYRARLLENKNIN
jgi:hypothetical protein